MIGGIELGGTKCVLAVANNPLDIIEKKIVSTRDPYSTISDIVSSDGHRIVELNVSYIPAFVDSSNVFVDVLKSLKRVKGVKMIKAIEHDDQLINLELEKQPLIF